MFKKPSHTVHGKAWPKQMEFKSHFPFKIDLFFHKHTFLVTKSEARRSTVPNEHGNETQTLFYMFRFKHERNAFKKAKFKI